MSHGEPRVSTQRILCVDLDGTLIRTDMLLESLCDTLRRKPLLSLAIPIWLLRGRAYLKRRLAESMQFDPASLPYHEGLLQHLRDEHQRGRKLVLATASDRVIAERIAAHLGIFSAVHGSDGGVNLKGKVKLQHLVAAYGEDSFDYAGNSPADDPLWEKSQEALVVGNVKPGGGRLPAHITVRAFPSAGESKMAAFVRAIRVHQWVKNLLLFVPMLMAHRARDGAVLQHSLTAFSAFCLCSSAVYVLNDVFDLESDRQHHSKRRRPFASGDLSLSTAFVIVPIFLIFSIALSLQLPPVFTDALLFYFVLTLGYSLRLKQIVLIDILVLASLYTIRILAGGFAADVRVSEWLLAFSLFFFLSLACIKRFSELFVLRQSNRHEAKGRGYVASDLEQISQFGSASGYISVLVLALYVSGRDVAALYSHPQVLWLTCPLVLYWISRVWLIAHRGKLHDDPIVFAIRDKTSYVVGLIALALMYLAI